MADDDTGGCSGPDWMGSMGQAWMRMDVDAHHARARGTVDDEEVQELSSQLFSHLATVLPADPRTSLEPARLKEATLADLGVTSQMGMALKGWVLRQLQAELTTFQLMKSPTAELLELIATERKREFGCVIPELQTVPAPA